MRFIFLTNHYSQPIKKELAHFHSQVRNCEVNLKVMDSQYSISQGIVLTAVGSFDRVENGALKSRRFVQTFFLEAQTPNSYSIRNDMLRYLNETPKTVVIAKEEAKPHAVPAPTAATNGTPATSTCLARTSSAAPAAAWACFASSSLRRRFCSLCNWSMRWSSEPLSAGAGAASLRARSSTSR